MEKTCSMNGLCILIEGPNGAGSNSVSGGWQ
jgi:hypothetical protein